MGDSRRNEISTDGQSGRESRFRDYTPRISGGDVFPPPPVAPGAEIKNPPPPVAPGAEIKNPPVGVAGAEIKGGQANPAARPKGVGSDGTVIKDNVPDGDIVERPPTYKEALEWRRGQVNDHLADRDRSLWRVGQWFWNTTIANRGARYIEPPTAVERTQLQTIETAITGGPGPGIARLVRDREQILTQIESRGRWRGPACVLGVTLANWGVDQVLFPKDHIKYGTLLADFGGAMGVMFSQASWRYKAAGMMAMHAAGRIYDHFLQGREATNAYKPAPGWERSSEIGRALKGVDPANKNDAAEPERPVYRPPNAGIVQGQSERDNAQRDANAERQRQAQDEAQRRHQAWQEALKQWKQGHPDASQKDESQFMRDWFRQNRK